MDHIAIMHKSWGLTEKIVTRQKTIESRWYNLKNKPWRKISSGDTIYFKNAGEPITIQAVVEKVRYYSDLTPVDVQTILDEYSKGIGIEEADIPTFFEKFKHKRYCILIYLKHAKRIPPFKINKQGFGAMSSWICVEHISTIKV